MSVYKPPTPEERERINREVAERFHARRDKDARIAGLEAENARLTAHLEAIREARNAEFDDYWPALMSLQRAIDNPPTTELDKP